LLVLEQDNHEIFQKYLQDFERIWKHAQPLHNPRVCVPANYVDMSSEKAVTADHVARIVHERAVEKDGILECLDIGCGDGTQSLLTFNKIVDTERWEKVSVTLLDPSLFAVEVCSDKLMQNKHLFTSPGPIVQKMWQLYDPKTRYDFVFCCHALGAIFHQCATVEAFGQEVERMLSILASDGLLASPCRKSASIRSPSLHQTGSCVSYLGKRPASNCNSEIAIGRRRDRFYQRSISRASCGVGRFLIYEERYSHFLAWNTG